MRVVRFLPVAFLLFAAACGGRMREPAGGPGAVASAPAVERFLQLAREDRYIEMGWIFGTSAGAAVGRWPDSEVEQRMYALATVLEHDSAVVERTAPVPGRLGSAETVHVRLRQGTRSYEVPFTTVQGPGRRWFVETVDVQAVTAPR